MGKSTLVNALLGEKVAKEGTKLDPETSGVESFTGKIQEIDVTVWDSAGLQDGNKNDENKYLKDIKKNCDSKILYCISMDATRFSKGSLDIEVNENPWSWENAVIILTYANREIRSMKKLILKVWKQSSMGDLKNGGFYNSAIFTSRCRIISRGRKRNQDTTCR